MDSLIETIRGALATDATPEARAAGASACRTVLGALEGRPGEPATPAAPAPNVPAEIVALASALRGVPADQLLDLAVAKLRSMVPTDQRAPVRSIKIPIIPVRR